MAGSSGSSSQDQRPPGARSRNRARDRGRDHERRTAELLGGHVYVGQAGDVVVGDWIIECKYRAGLRLDHREQLREWVEQASANARAWTRKGQPKEWAIVLYGGRGTDRYAVIPLAALQRLGLQGIGIPEAPASNVEEGEVGSQVLPESDTSDDEPLPDGSGVPLPGG